MNCDYCGCPSAAEIEHVLARANGGKSHMDNLVLSCPYCNKKKATREVEEFRQSGDWKLPPPPDMPDTMSAMLRLFFGIEEGTQLVWSGSANARLILLGERAEIQVRPGRKYPWRRISLGDPDSPRAIHAAWDFLARHFTPDKPRQAKVRGRRQRRPGS